MFVAFVYSTFFYFKLKHRRFSRCAFVNNKLTDSLFYSTRIWQLLCFAMMLPWIISARSSPESTSQRIRALELCAVAMESFTARATPKNSLINWHSFAKCVFTFHLTYQVAKVVPKSALIAFQQNPRNVTKRKKNEVWEKFFLALNLQLVSRNYCVIIGKDKWEVT